MLLKIEDVPGYLTEHEEVLYCEHLNPSNLANASELHSYTDGGKSFADPIIDKIGCKECFRAALVAAGVEDEDTLFMRQSAVFMGLGTDRVFADPGFVSPIGKRRS